MSEKTHFHLSGYMNKQKLRFRLTENLHIIHETPLHPLKVTIWYGVYAMLMT